MYAAIQHISICMLPICMYRYIDTYIDIHLYTCIYVFTCGHVHLVCIYTYIRGELRCSAPGTRATWPLRDGLAEARAATPDVVVTPALHSPATRRSNRQRSRDSNDETLARESAVVCTVLSLLLFSSSSTPLPPLPYPLWHSFRRGSARLEARFESSRDSSGRTRRGTRAPWFSLGRRPPSLAHLCHAHNFTAERPSDSRTRLSIVQTQPTVRKSIYVCLFAYVEKKI